MVGIMIIGFTIVLFIVLGIVFSSGRGAFLIAGYNTKSKDEQDTYDTVALTKFMGKMMFSLSVSMVLWMLSIALEMTWLFMIGLILFICITIFMLVYLNTANRFKK